MNNKTTKGKIMEKVKCTDCKFFGIDENGHKKAIVFSCEDTGNITWCTEVHQYRALTFERNCEFFTPKQETA